MYISEPTYNALNVFLGLNFQMNSFCDNIAYNLGFNKMVNAEKIFHEKFAHAFPAFADIISELMVSLEARPIRLALSQNDKMYPSNVAIFDDLKKNVDEYRNEILKVIEVADVNNDVEVKVVLEDFSNKFLPYLSQVNLWILRANQYGERVAKFDKDFEDFTTL